MRTVTFAFTGKGGVGKTIQTSFEGNRHPDRARRDRLCRCAGRLLAQPRQQVYVRAAPHPEQDHRPRAARQKILNKRTTGTATSPAAVPVVFERLF